MEHLISLSLWFCNHIGFCVCDPPTSLLEGPLGWHWANLETPGSFPHPKIFDLIASPKSLLPLKETDSQVLGMRLWTSLGDHSPYHTLLLLQLLSGNICATLFHVTNISIKRLTNTVSCNKAKFYLTRCFCSSASHASLSRKCTVSPKKRLQWAPLLFPHGVIFYSDQRFWFPQGYSRWGEGRGEGNRSLGWSRVSSLWTCRYLNDSSFTGCFLKVITRIFSP